MSSMTISPLTYTNVDSAQKKNAHVSSGTTQQTSGSSSSNSSSSSSSSTGGVSADEGTFLTLLVTQLKNQDPLSPTDSTQFVSELAQFSSLEQLININQNVSTMTNTVSGAGTASTTSDALTGAASGSTTGTTNSTGTSDYNSLLNGIG